jgi:hypothetical protein
MYVQPIFNTPPNDSSSACSENEIVIGSIGFEFKNWRNGYKDEDFVFNTTLEIASDVFDLPEIPFCYKYYYNQKEG